MNNYFDLSRFLQLFKKQTKENLRFYLMSLVVIAGILVILFGYLAYRTEGKLAYQADLQFKVYLICFLLSGAIFSSTIFSHFGDKKSCIMAIVLPCSRLEKFFVGWIYVFIIFPLIYSILFYLIDWSFVMSLSPKARGVVAFYNIFSAEEEQYIVFPIYLLLASLGILGAIGFRNLHFIKAGALFFGCAFLLVGINTFFLNRLIVNTLGGNMPFGGLSFIAGSEYYNINIENSLTYLIGTICIVAPMIWWSAYLKLKEREV
jgi:hypothetical protein